MRFRKTDRISHPLLQLFCTKDTRFLVLGPPGLVALEPVVWAPTWKASAVAEQAPEELVAASVFASTVAAAAREEAHCSRAVAGAEADDLRAFSHPVN